MDISDEDPTSDTREEMQGDEGDLTHEHVLTKPPRKTPNTQKDHDLAKSRATNRCDGAADC